MTNATMRDGLPVAENVRRRRKAKAAATEPRNAQASHRGDPTTWLTTQHEGRLDYQTGRGFRSVVVMYAVAGDQILFRVPDYNDIAHFASGEQVTLEVDAPQSTPQHPLTLCVTGRARLLRADQLPVPPDQLFQEPWPAGVATSIIGFPMEIVWVVDPQQQLGDAPLRRPVVAPRPS